MTHTCTYQGVEKQQVEPRPAPELENDSSPTSLQQVIADKVKYQDQNAFCS